MFNILSVFGLECTSVICYKDPRIAVRLQSTKEHKLHDLVKQDLYGQTKVRNIVVTCLCCAMSGRGEL